MLVLTAIYMVTTITVTFVVPPDQGMVLLLFVCCGVMMLFVAHLLLHLRWVEGMTMDESDPPKPKLRWYQFSLRELMVLVLVCSVVSAWVGWKLEQTRRELMVVARIESLGTERIGVEHDQIRIQNRAWQGYLSGL